jgi:hypothetical protein
MEEARIYAGGVTLKATSAPGAQILLGPVYAFSLEPLSGDDRQSITPIGYAGRNEGYVVLGRRVVLTVEVPDEHLKRGAGDFVFVLTPEGKNLDASDVVKKSRAAEDGYRIISEEWEDG